MPAAVGNSSAQCRIWKRLAIVRPGLTMATEGPARPSASLTPLKQKRPWSKPGRPSSLQASAPCHALHAESLLASLVSLVETSCSVAGHSKEADVSCQHAVHVRSSSLVAPAKPRRAKAGFALRRCICLNPEVKLGCNVCTEDRGQVCRIIAKLSMK